MWGFKHKILLHCRGTSHLLKGQGAYMMNFECLKMIYEENLM